MIKRISKHFIRFRNIFLVTSVILLTGIILALGWVNLRDFERSVSNSELRELLIIAKSASRDIESGIIAIKQEPQYIYKLIQYINDVETLNTFVLDNKHIILIDTAKKRVGKNIFEVGKEVLNAQELSKLNAFMKKLDNNISGTAILSFPTEEDKPKKEMHLFAFAKLQEQNSLYSVVVTERLNALTGPIRRNLRDTLLLVGLFFLVFSTFGYIFYRIQKKIIQVETTSRALEIINKQLHCEIDDYKSIEKRLKEHRK